MVPVGWVDEGSAIFAHVKCRTVVDVADPSPERDDRG